MARLSLSLLGPFQVTLDGQPVTGFKSNKVRALLAYLAVEADRPHRREVLAGLLWPEWPDREAMSSLRYALSNLRQAIGDREAEPPYLLITRETLQFNRASDQWLDVAAFTEVVAGEGAQSQDVQQLEQGAALYRGGFLEGFTVDDSAGFEDWALLARERLQREAMSALRGLAEMYEQQGEFEQAQRAAWRQLELEPWDEAAHQQLMRVLALSGQRSAALAQYESCRRVLTQELGVEPGVETTRLYEQIRDGRLRSPKVVREFATGAIGQPAASGPSVRLQEPAAVRQARFLEQEAPEVERPLFVARERELAQLDGYLEQALAGQGRVVFVTGEAGSGKTALLQEFALRAQEAHGGLVVASGNCNAYTGIGDPYLPFREIIALLAGDVEARWAAGAMSREQALRLWHMLPLTVQALVDLGPDLIDTFVPQAALLERAAAFPPGVGESLVKLDKALERRPLPSVRGSLGPQQSDLFEQYTRVLQALASRAPLLLAVDDLQWADLGSISLLFHLGRHLAGSRILVVGAFRPEEVAIGRDGQRHPLESMLNEFGRAFGDITIQLGEAESRDFLQALLDSEPNELGEEFRDMLYRQTRGHALFTVELLRGLQEQGDLVRDPGGRWVEGAALDWDRLPARVDAIIAERVGRLDQPLRATLRVASVEGEVFTAEVVARVRGSDEREEVRRLSRQLDRRHRLLRAEAIDRLGSQRVSRYRFRHLLVQKYLYDSMDDVERAYLHEDVGNVLEELYGDRSSDIAAQLARHFQEARNTQKAIYYLRQAGEKAVQLSAYQEAIPHLTAGLALLMTQLDSLQRAEQELALQMALGRAWNGLEGMSPKVEQAIIRARDLCQHLGRSSLLCRVTGELSLLHYVRAEHQNARDLAEEALDLAQQVGDPLHVACGHWQLGLILFCLGEYSLALSHLEQVLAFYDPEQHHRSFVMLRAADAGPSALAYSACCLWCLGFPDQADRRSQEALALARGFGHPFTLADVLCYGGCVFNEMYRDAQAFTDTARELRQLAQDKLPAWFGQATWLHGGALATLGHLEEGIAQMREGLALSQSTANSAYWSGCLLSLAKALAETGRLEEGLSTLADAKALVEETDERYCEAELHRLKGELLQSQGDEAGAEASYHQAIEVACRQQARSWELRATMSLCRLWQSQGRVEEAREMLAEIYGWFTEGFDTPDLIDARALLEALLKAPA